MPRPGQTPAPQYKRSPQLPYGSVQRANAATPRQGSRQGPVAIGTGSTGPQTEEELFLYGPTLRPTEPLTAGAPFGPGPSPPPPGMVPENIRRSLPLLEQLAAEPDSPPQLRTIVDYLLHKAR